MTFCGYGRLTKKEITKSLVSPLPKVTVLCSDGHVSYKGYDKDNGLECVTLRGDLGQHVKKDSSTYNTAIHCTAVLKSG